MKQSTCTDGVFKTLESPPTPSDAFMHMHFRALKQCNWRQGIITDQTCSGVSEYIHGMKMKTPKGKIVIPYNGDTNDALPDLVPWDDVIMTTNMMKTGQ